MRIHSSPGSSSLPLSLCEWLKPATYSSAVTTLGTAVDLITALSSSGKSSLGLYVQLIDDTIVHRPTVAFCDASGLF